jgi:hypothetical protein
MLKNRAAGFALVEALVIGTIVALIAGVTIIMLTAKSGTTSSRQACRDEAKHFAEAVHKFHDSPKNTQHKWPGGEDKQHVFGLVLYDLANAKPPYFSASGPDRLAGIQHDSRSNEPGWVYDFDNHTTYDAGCG